LIVGFAVVGVGIAVGEAGDCGAEVMLGLRELAALEVPCAQGGVAAGVVGVAAEGLSPIDFGVARGVAVLLEVEAG
jgi:hypothetical protein